MFSPQLCSVSKFLSEFRMFLPEFLEFVFLLWTLGLEQFFLDFQKLFAIFSRISHFHGIFNFFRIFWDFLTVLEVSEFETSFLNLIQNVAFLLEPWKIFWGFRNFFYSFRNLACLWSYREFLVFPVFKKVFLRNFQSQFCAFSRIWNHFPGISWILLFPTIYLFIPDFAIICERVVYFPGDLGICNFCLELPKFDTFS